MVRVPTKAATAKLLLSGPRKDNMTRPPVIPNIPKVKNLSLILTKVKGYLQKNNRNTEKLVVLRQDPIPAIAVYKRSSK